MSDTDKYDDLLFAILCKEGHTTEFLDVVFNFLFRRTDFFKIQHSSSEKLGFPPGIAQNMVKNAFYKYYQMALLNEKHRSNLPSKASVEECTINEVVETIETEKEHICEPKLELHEDKDCRDMKDEPEKTVTRNDMDGDKPASVSHQKPKYYQSYSECYNGAVLDSYCWSQTIKDIDIQIKVPSDVTAGKQVKVKVSNTHLKAEALKDGKWEVLTDGDLTWKVNVEESTWTLIPGEHIHVCLQKLQERWWEAVLVDEPKIDIRSIDSSQPYEDLDEESQAKIKELMYNEHQKKLGKPTIQQTKIQEILKEAWDKEKSPFKGQPYDPNIINIADSESAFSF